MGYETYLYGDTYVYCQEIEMQQTVVFFYSKKYSLYLNCEGKYGILF